MPYKTFRCEKARKPELSRKAPHGWNRCGLLGRLRQDRGMNTAEYAVGTLAAVAFAGLLFKVVTSDSVRGALAALFERALG